MQRYTWLSSFTAVFALAIGFITLSGWLFDVSIPLLIPVDTVPVLPNTAVGLIACSFALLLIVHFPVSRERRWFSHILALFCILLGGLTLLEYLFNFNFGIDDLIAQVPPSIGSTPRKFPGRMASYTALNFVLKGLSLIFIDYETRRGHRPSQYLSLLTMITPIQALLGYSYGIENFTALGSYSYFVQMAPPTALCWILLSLGTLYARPRVGVMTVLTSKTPAGRFVRKLFVPAIAIPVLMGGFVATAENFQSSHVGLSASLLTVTCISLFMFILWKNGMELLRVQNERDRAINDLKTATQEAQQANRVKSTFLANMSHEIRSPVGVIMGFTDLLADPQCSPSVRSYYSEVVKRNGRTLLTILNDILDLSKVEADKLKVEMAPIDLTSLIRDLYLVFKTEAVTKGLQLKFDWIEPVPTKIVTDGNRLRQILTNLLNNALKFTSRGFVALRIESVSSDATSAILSFEVEDTGLGVPDHHREKLFQPFEQADSSTTRKFGGTGLGLALSKRLASALSGDLNLKESRPGKGSTFSLRLHVQLADSAVENSPVAEGPKESRLVGQKVLVAEDSPDNRFLIEHILKSEGARVEMVANGAEAVTKALGSNFDVVLMDIQMPTMDGLEATARLREKGYQKPIVALTAHAMKEDKLRSLASGLNDHVTKPINREELIRVLQRWFVNQA